MSYGDPVPDLHGLVEFVETNVQYSTSYVTEPRSDTIGTIRVSFDLDDGSNRFVWSVPFSSADIYEQITDLPRMILASLARDCVLDYRERLMDGDEVTDAS